MKRLLMVAGLICTASIVTPPNNPVGDTAPTTAMVALPVVFALALATTLLYRGVNALQFLWQTKSVKPKNCPKYADAKATTLNTLRLYQIWYIIPMIISTLSFAALGAMPLATTVLLPAYLFIFTKYGFGVYQLQCTRDRIASDQPASLLDVATLTLLLPLLS